MTNILEELLVMILNRLLTKDVVAGAEAELVALLRSLAAKSGSEFYSKLVEIVASALGVP